MATPSDMVRITFRVAAWCTMVACAPRPATPPPLPPQDLSEASFVEPRTPYVEELPALPPAPLGPRGPGEFVLAVSAEISAAELGAVSTSEAGAPTLALRLEPCRLAPSEADTLDTAGQDHCRRVNQETFDERSQRALVISPGLWEIALTNGSFDRELGLWLRSETDPGTPIVSSGGVAHGETRRWQVELPAGRYIYSCPLSPTPDYVLIVR